MQPSADRGARYRVLRADHHPHLVGKVGVLYQVMRNGKLDLEFSKTPHSSGEEPGGSSVLFAPDYVELVSGPPATAEGQNEPQAPPGAAEGHSQRMVSIPFSPEFEPKMLGGEKVSTSRTKRYGQAGDRFEAFGAEFELTKVERQTLNFVAASLYKAEGCNSPVDFVYIWNHLHPRKGWAPKQRVWVHHFAVVAGQAERPDLSVAAEAELVVAHYDQGRLL